MESNEVSLFRCKRCKVRMFERDCAGHLQRHGIDVADMKERQIFAQFERGPRDTAAHPGANVKPLYYQTKGRRRSGGGSDELEDDVDLN